MWSLLRRSRRPGCWASMWPSSSRFARRQVSLPEQVRIDARMPEHGHGMNYRPSLQARGPGRWRAEGLMLHMAGRWELSFELRRGDQVDRLTRDIQAR